MAVKYRLKKRFEESGIIIRGIFGPINKDTLNERIIDRICSMGLAGRFLEPVEEDAKNDSGDVSGDVPYSLSDLAQDELLPPLKCETGDADETQGPKPKRKRRKKSSGE